MKKINKQYISTIALSLFSEKGYNNVTINEICEACQITKPTFYKYAGSKEDLILDLYDVTIHDIVTNSYQFVQVNSHYEQFLVVFDTLITESMRFGSDLFSQMIISNLRRDYKSFDCRDSLTKLCVLILEKAQATGEIQNRGDANILYGAIAHMFSGYELNWCIKNGKTDWAREFYQSVAAILNVKEELLSLHEKYLHEI